MGEKWWCMKNTSMFGKQRIELQYFIYIPSGAGPKEQQRRSLPRDLYYGYRPQSQCCKNWFKEKKANTWSWSVIIWFFFYILPVSPNILDLLKVVCLLCTMVNHPYHRHVSVIMFFTFSRHVFFKCKSRTPTTDMFQPTQTHKNTAKMFTLRLWGLFLFPFAFHDASQMVVFSTNEGCGFRSKWVSCIDRSSLRRWVVNGWTGRKFICSATLW